MERASERLAARLIRDPHAVPRVPTVLEEAVAASRHQIAVSSLAQEALAARRSHYDQERLARASQSAISLDEDVQLPNVSPQRTHRRRRHTMYEAATLPPPLGPRRLSVGAVSQVVPIEAQYVPVVSFKALGQLPDATEKLRRRCNGLKAPHPALWGRRRASVAEGTYPLWHALLRSDYRRAGREQQWRLERERFLQDNRRSRAFASLTRRRSMPPMNEM